MTFSDIFSYVFGFLCIYIFLYVILGFFFRDSSPEEFQKTLSRSLDIFMAVVVLPTPPLWLLMEIIMILGLFSLVCFFGNYPSSQLNPVPYGPSPVSSVKRPPLYALGSSLRFSSVVSLSTPSKRIGAPYIQL